MKLERPFLSEDAQVKRVLVEVFLSEALTFLSQTTLGPSRAYVQGSW